MQPTPTSPVDIPTLWSLTLEPSGLGRCCPSSAPIPHPPKAPLRPGQSPPGKWAPGSMGASPLPRNPLSRLYFSSLPPLPLSLRGFLPSPPPLPSPQVSEFTHQRLGDALVVSRRTLHSLAPPSWLHPLCLLFLAFPEPRLTH